MSDFPAARLHVVSGKGGTGKTTVAAALALALAAGGRKVLLMEVEGRQGLAQLFDSPPLPYEERKVAVAPGGGDVYALAVDAEQALLDYLHMFYKLSPNGLPARTLRKIGAIDFATTIAPGIRDVLLTGKVKEVTTRAGSRGGRYYDAVVVDAPPTGRIPRFLNITHEVGNLAKVGPLKAQSDGVMAVFKSPQTVVHLVTLLEEMPVQETVEAIEELTALGLPVGGVVVNMVRAPFLSHEDVAAVAAGTAARRLSAGLKTAGVDPALAPVLLQEASEHAARVALEERGHDALAHLQRPTYELPLLPDAVDLGGLYQLAAALKAQGMA
ncbi:MAG: Anion-transporting ATPase [Frankiales bacterium]|jgi:anion-transporting  ArsA/GET3 family ATPase|nr:Anion-transporting ATPase [Frankiales bacterium]